MNLAPRPIGDARAPAFEGRFGPEGPTHRADAGGDLSIAGRMSPLAGGSKMVGKTTEAWTVSILAVLGLVIALNSLGLSVPDVLGSIVHGAEHVLNHPL
jgi:hypothetical protein